MVDIIQRKNAFLFIFLSECKNFEDGKWYKFDDEIV